VAKEVEAGRGGDYNEVDLLLRRPSWEHAKYLRRIRVTDLSQIMGERGVWVDNEDSWRMLYGNDGELITEEQARSLAERLSGSLKLSDQ
jgi:hypothetical protein